MYVGCLPPAAKPGQLGSGHSGAGQSASGHPRSSGSTSGRSQSGGSASGGSAVFSWCLAHRGGPAMRSRAWRRRGVAEPEHEVFECRTGRGSEGLTCVAKVVEAETRHVYFCCELARTLAAPRHRASACHYNQRTRGHDRPTLAYALGESGAREAEWIRPRRYILQRHGGWERGRRPGRRPRSGWLNHASRLARRDQPAGPPAPGEVMRPRRIDTGTPHGGFHRANAPARCPRVRGRWRTARQRDCGPG